MIIPHDRGSSPPVVRSPDFFAAWAKLGHVLDAFVHLTQQRGNIFYLSFNPFKRGPARTLFVADLELIKTILTDANAFPKTTRGRSVIPIFGENFLASPKAHEVSPKRSAVRQELFVGDAMARIEADIRRYTASYMERFAPGSIIGLQGEIRKLVMFGVLSALIGGGPDPDDTSVQDAVEGILFNYAKGSQAGFISLPVLPQFYEKRVGEYGLRLHAALGRRLAAGADGPLVRIARHIEPSDPMPVLSELTTISYHNTAIMLCRVFEHLLGQPEIVERIRAEIDCSSGVAERKEHTRRPLVDAVLQESLRLSPPIGIFARTAVEDFKFRDWIIPRGTTLIICPHVIHRLPAYWPAPNVFQPERFLADDPEPFAFLPFSHGRRSCVGNEFALLQARHILTQILRRYRLRKLPVAKGREPMQGYRPFGKNPLLVEIYPTA